MRIFLLEMKKIIKTKTTWILLIVCLFLSAILAYIPVTFENSCYKNAAGERIRLQGIDAVHYQQKMRKDISGAVTWQKIQRAVEEYQGVLKEYNVKDSFEIPEEVYYEKLAKYEPLVHGVKEVFADSQTGRAPGLTELDVAEIRNFYEQAPHRLVSLLRLEGNSSSVIVLAEEMYKKIETPLQYYSGISGNSMDYQVLCIFFMTLCCAVIVSPVFSIEYQTGADDILRCTKYGRSHLAVAKILAAFCITATTFLLCGCLWIALTNAFYGWESTKTSMQMIFSISSLPALNMGELEWMNLAGSFLLFSSLMSFILFLSSKIRNAALALTSGVFVCILPTLFYAGAPEVFGTWLQCMWPGGAIGMNNCFLYAMTELNFLHIGNAAVWNVYLMLIISALWIPVFLVGTVVTYSRKSM